MLKLLLIVLLRLIHVVCVIDIETILSTLTLPEKIGQMVQIDINLFIVPGTTTVNHTLLKSWINDYQIGSILNSPFSNRVRVDGQSGWNATQWREVISFIQSTAMNTTSKIPILYGIDSIHGATYISRAALFPQQIALAASFNPSIVYNIGTVTAKDTRASGIPWIFAPVLGLGLQPLWARFPETFGEDPYVASILGTALIKGIQSITDDGGIPTRAAACMKHFIGYSLPYNGHDRSPVQLPDRILKELYVPAFKAAIQDAHVLSAMESYQEVGGVPMISSYDYLTKLLRKELNFTGMMVTDYAEIENLHNWHYVADSQEHAVQISMQQTTVDMSMVPNDNTFNEYLLSLVESGKVSESRIDDSVRRILELKQTLGLFDNPIPPLSDPLITTVGQDSDWELSLNASRESITLLKNEMNLLPLRPSDTTTYNLLVTGYTCNSLVSQTGGWSFHWQGAVDDAEFPNGVTIFEGLTNIYSSSSIVTYFEGPALNAADLSGVNLTALNLLAAEATHIVSCVCEEKASYAEKPGDIDDLNLPAGQNDFIAALNQTGKPIILVLVEGRPRIIHDAVTMSQAVINAYQPGPMGGQAVAEIIAGRVVPSGRLPFTYPRYTADVVYPYYHKPSDMCTTTSSDGSSVYYENCQVEWNFGDGLSYTSFQYSNFSLSSNQFNQYESLQVYVTVTNSGEYDAMHTVLVFVYDVYRSVTPEYKLLKRFDKVFVVAGESVDLQWTLTDNDLMFVGINSRYILESGQYIVGVSPDNLDCRMNMYDEESCQTFQYQTASSYRPTCDYACDLWKEGVCQQTVDAIQCNQTCFAQDWSWNYVDCLEQFSLQSGCSGWDDIQCYDAGFAVQDDTVESDDDEDDKYSYTEGYIVAVLLMTSLLSFAMGGCILWIILKVNSVKTTNQSVIESLYSPLSNNDEMSNDPNRNMI